MPTTGCWEERTQKTWIHGEGYIEDGRLVNLTKVFKMYNGEKRLTLYLYDSFTTNQQGNFLRKFICTLLQSGYKDHKRHFGHQEKKGLKISLG